MISSDQGIWNDFGEFERFRKRSQLLSIEFESDHESVFERFFEVRVILGDVDIDVVSISGSVGL